MSCNSTVLLIKLLFFKGREKKKSSSDAYFLRRSGRRSNIMAAPNVNKRGLEHLDEYEPKPAKHLRSLHDRMAERRLVVILEGASLETVKVNLQRCVSVLL